LEDLVPTAQFAHKSSVDARAGRLCGNGEGAIGSKRGSRLAGRKLG
jgi:hypothetical protein